MGFGVREHARTESISKRAPSIGPPPDVFRCRRRRLPVATFQSGDREKPMLAVTLDDRPVPCTAFSVGRCAIGKCLRCEYQTGREAERRRS